MFETRQEFLKEYLEEPTKNPHRNYTFWKEYIEKRQMKSRENPMYKYDTDFRKKHLKKSPEESLKEFLIESQEEFPKESLKESQKKHLKKSREKTKQE